MPPGEEAATSKSTAGSSNTSNSNSTSNLTVNNVIPFNFQSHNLAEEWKIWKKKYDIYELASGLDKESDKRRVAMLLHSMEGNGIDIYSSFNLMPNEEYKFDIVVSRFSEHFDSKSPITLLRHKFFTSKQLENQSIMEFKTEIQNLSQSCKFGSLREELVRDIFIAGLLNKKLQIMLLKEDNLSIDKAVNMCRAVETSVQHVNHNNNNIQIHKVNSKKYQTQSNSKKCYRCNGSFTHNHLKVCPAKSATCFKCKQQGHFSKYCRNKSKQNCNEIYERPHEEEERFFIGEVHEWKQDVAINDVSLTFKLDTGSPVNIISLKHYNNIFPKNCKTKPKILKRKYNLCSVSNDRIPVIGIVFLTCFIRSKGIKQNLEFVICKIDCSPLLGLKSCLDLKLLQRVSTVNSIQDYKNIYKDYSHLFDGEVGTIGPEYHIKLTKDAIPRIDSQRKIPFGLRDLLKDELDHMEKSGIIKRVIEPTEWVNSIVIVKKKNNKIRICLDPRYLNKFIVTSNSSIPTFEQISSKLDGAKYFSVLDCNKGFWMIPLESKSSLICTFNSPLGGRYCFKKLPFGLSCASEAFQERINFLFENEDGVEPYIDDILVFGKTKQEHDSRLLKVLQIAKDSGMKFNRSKCKFGLQEVKFLGHKISKDGISMDPDKIEAVVKMPNPTSKKELERLIGFFNYLSRFIKNFSELTSPLRDLLKSKDFVWSDVHSQSLNKLKNIVTSQPVLRTYDPNKDLVLSVDSSIEGVGAILLQDNAPIAYASKALTLTQKKAWAQVEREMFAIVFGCIKFHQYILGKIVTVETDHKALENLFKKPMNLIPARIQRLMLKIQAYSLIVKYKPGSLLYLADTLSRSPLPNYELENLNTLEYDIVCHVNQVVHNLPISKVKLNEILEETNNDPVLTLLKETIFKGWPKNKNQIYDEIKPYWNFREELHIINDLIFRNNALVIPKKLQAGMLYKIHEGHLGITYSCNRAKDILFWPNMLNQITNMCLTCHTCQIHQPNNPKEEILFHDIPSIPWSKLGCDLFEFHGQNYILVVDYFSKFFEIGLLPNITALNVITQMKSMFARHGIPRLIICDSGSQFTSREFRDFSLNYEFDYICSSPYHHQSNGLAESHVKIIKNILKKSKTDCSDPYLGILNYRNTPKGNSPSPAQLLFSRSLRTRIPVSYKHLKPKIMSRNKKMDMYYQNKTKHSYNRNTKKLKEIDVGADILFKKNNNPLWIHGKIHKKSQNRSYEISDKNGNHYIRNRCHLKIYNKHPHITNTMPVTSSPSPNQYHSTSPQSSPEVALHSYRTRSGRTIKIPSRLNL